MNAAGAAAAGKAFLHATQAKVVEDEEILRRAQICGQCPLRARVTTLADRVSQLLGRTANQFRVPKAISKYKCGVCHCSLMLLVPALPEDLHEDDEKEAAKRAAQPTMKPGTQKPCWVLTAHE